jgi:Tape measure protein
MAAPISSYFARVAIDVDQSSLKKVDDYFKALEAKMKRYQGRMGSGLAIKVKVDIDTRATLLNLRRKLDMVGQNLTLTVKRMNFAINGKQIRSQAEKQLSAGIRVKVEPWITRNSMIDLRKQLSAGLQNLPVTVRYAGNLRQSLISRIGQAFAPSGGGGRSRGNSGGRRSSRDDGFEFPSLMSGPLNRMLRFGAGAVPFVGGAVGVNTLNQANTDYQSQKLAAQGIFEGKIEGGGNAARQQLFNLAQLNGIDYKATLPNFTRFMASAMPSMNYGGAFNSFQSILEFGRARGATGESMERALYAFSQIAGKGKVMSEELFGQLSEAAGFGESGDIFAQAYAQKTKSGLSGQKAQAALREAMKEGKVISGDILPIVAQIMSERAAPMLSASRNTADAQQMRFRNARAKFIERFSESGGEKALAKMWDTIGKLMEDLSRRAPEVAQAFSTLVDAFAKAVEVMKDLSNTLWFGETTGTSKSIQEATGVNLVAIRDGIHAMIGVLGAIGEKLGVGGSVVALAATYGIGKLIKSRVGNTVGDVVDKVTGNTSSLGAYAMPGMSALRVWVVNGSGAGFDSSVPTPEGKGGKAPAGRKPPGWLSLGFLTKWLSLPAIATGLAMLHPNQDSPTVTADPMYMSGGMAGIYGTADSFTKKNISAAQPVVEQAAVAATMNHNIVLTADVKIEAGTPESAIQQFQQQLDAKVFQPFMLQSLQEAQSTVSVYAR